MNREQGFERLNRIFRDNFDDESIVVDDRTTALDIDDWDSLEQINLIVAIEKEFRIKFEVGGVNFRNVGEMMDAIMEKGGR